MSERFALPGFQLPDAPKDKSRVFVQFTMPFEVTFLHNTPRSQPLRQFNFYISLEAGEMDARLLAYSRSDNFVLTRDNPLGGRDYLIRLFGDALAIHPGVYVLRVTEHNEEIFKTVVNVRPRPLPHYSVCVDKPVCRPIVAPCGQEENMIPNSPNLGPPTSGQHFVNDTWLDGAFARWRCVTDGTPGTWVQLNAAVVAAGPAGPLPLNYLITIPGDNWAQFYWDGAEWQPVFLEPLT